MGALKSALVRIIDGYVENVVMADAAAGNYPPPQGYNLVSAEGVWVEPGDWHINNVFVPHRIQLDASPNPATPNATMMVRAILPAGSPDTTVTFQVEGGAIYSEPVATGQANHAFAFASAGIYRVLVSSAHHGTAAVEVMVQ